MMRLIINVVLSQDESIKYAMSAYINDIYVNKSLVLTSLGTLDQF